MCKMKRKMAIMLVLTILLALPATALAGINVFINDQDYTFDPAPTIQNGRTLVPMRAFFEAMGADVEWEIETRTAVGKRNDTEVRIPVGSDQPTVDGDVLNIDVPAVTRNDRTFVPLRFVGEAFGDTVDWDGDTRTINIYWGKKKPAKPAEPAEPMEPVENEVTLSISRENQGSVLINGETLLAEDTITVEKGSEFELRALPAPAWEFSHWQQDVSGSDEVKRVQADEDMQIKAVFERSQNNGFDLYTSIGSDTIGTGPRFDGACEGYLFHIYLDSLIGDVNIINLERLGYTYGNYQVLDSLGDPWEGDYEYNERFGTGFGSCIPNIEEGEAIFTDLHVKAQTKEGETVEGGIRIFIDQDQQLQDPYEDPPAPNEEYDTELLRHEACFEIEVEDDIYWVSAANLGKPQFNKEELKDMQGDPDTLKVNIETVYDALHYLDASGYETYSGNVRIDGDGGRWEHYEPGRNSLKTNSGNCAATANTIVYLLEDNYEEVGFVLWWYSLDKGGGHFMNYVRHEGNYYLFDATAYKDYLTAAIEEESLRSYNNSDMGTNIHRVAPEDLASYVDHYRSLGRQEITFFSLIEQKGDLFPIDNISRGSKHIRAVPYGKAGTINEIYNDPSRPVIIEEVSAPQREPDLEKYHPSHCYENSSFVGCN